VSAAALGWLGAVGGLLATASYRARLRHSCELVSRACHELRSPLTAAGLALHAIARSGELPASRVHALDLELSRAGAALEDLAAARDRRPPVDHHEAIDYVLTHHGLAIAAVPTGCVAPRLLGWVQDDAREAFAHIAETGPLDATALGQALGWSESRSREALGDLTLHRLVRPVGELYYPLQTA